MALQTNGVVSQEQYEKDIAVWTDESKPANDRHIAFIRMVLATEDHHARTLMVSMVLKSIRRSMKPGRQRDFHLTTIKELKKFATQMRKLPIEQAKKIVSQFWTAKRFRMSHEVAA